MSDLIVVGFDNELKADEVLHADKRELGSPVFLKQGGKAHRIALRFPQRAFEQAATRADLSAVNVYHGVDR